MPQLWFETSRLPATCVLILAGIALTLGLSGSVSSRESLRSSDLRRIREVEGDRIYTLLPPDGIPAIDDPKFVPAGEADFMKSNEWVVGVSRNGVTKAYSLWHLDRHEIVNDWFGREPVAVTW